jgi:hypothetical protein
MSRPTFVPQNTYGRLKVHKLSGYAFVHHYTLPQELPSSPNLCSETSKMVHVIEA